jgi:hypothetical protein
MYAVNREPWNELTHCDTQDDLDERMSEPPTKRARPLSIFGNLKRSLSGRRKNTREGILGSRLSDMRHSVMGTLSRGADAISPAFGVSLDLQQQPSQIESFRFAFVRDSKAGKTSLIE